MPAEEQHPALQRRCTCACIRVRVTEWVEVDRGVPMAVSGDDAVRGGVHRGAAVVCV